MDPHGGPSFDSSNAECLSPTNPSYYLQLKAMSNVPRTTAIDLPGITARSYDSQKRSQISGIY